MFSKSPTDQTIPVWIRIIQDASRLLGVFAAGLILLSVLVICHMVFTRAVLGHSSIWHTEFVTYSLIAATLLGAPYVSLTRGHVAVDLLPLMVNPRARQLLHLTGSFITLVFLGIFLYSAIPWWMDAWSSGHTSPSIWAPRLWIPYLAVLVGLAMLCLQVLAEAWLVWTRREHPFGLRPEDRI